MSAYSPTLPRTAELRGTDRLLVLAGSALADLGRRRADARARTLAARRTVAAAPAASTPTFSTDAFEAASERLRDRAAMSRVSFLP